MDILHLDNNTITKPIINDMGYKSKNIQHLIDEMENDPLYVKLRRWLRLKVWTYKCLTRKYWDKQFEGYLFKKTK